MQSVYQMQKNYTFNILKSSGRKHFPISPVLEVSREKLSLGEAKHWNSMSGKKIWVQVNWPAVCMRDRLSSSVVFVRPAVPQCCLYFFYFIFFSTK